ncbi:MAG: DUF2059 domain-containing protein [Pseudomonadota bacterium]
MTIKQRILTIPRIMMFALAIITVSGVSVSAQEISESHKEAARLVMKSTGISARLDSILPEIAAFTKTGLIANRPDIENEISIIVDEAAIELAPRRGPLESEVAAIYTKLYTEDELREIGEFFAGDTGQKFLRLTTDILQQVESASRVWRNGLTRDLSQKVQEMLKEQGLQ